MNVRWVIAVMVSMSCLGLAPPGHAQQRAAPSIQQNVEKRLQEIAPLVPPEDRYRTGKDDLILFREREFFTVKLDTGFGYASNAFSSDDNKKHDYSWNENLNFRAETVIAEKYTVFADLGAFLSRYARSSTLNYDGVIGTVGVRNRSGPWTAGATYSASIVAEPGLDVRIVSQHSPGASISYTADLTKDTALITSVSVSRALAAPADFTNTAVRFGVTALHRLAPTVLATATVQGSGKWYDDYFEAANGEARTDAGLDAVFSILWASSEIVSVNGAVAIGYVDSTLDSSDYFNVSVTPTLSLQARF